MTAEADMYGYGTTTENSNELRSELSRLREERDARGRERDEARRDRDFFDAENQRSLARAEAAEKERDAAREEVACYEAMKSGVAVRIADLESERDAARAERDEARAEGWEWYRRRAGELESIWKNRAERAESECSRLAAALGQVSRWLEETHAAMGDEGAIELLAMLRVPVPSSQRCPTCKRDFGLHFDRCPAARALAPAASPATQGETKKLTEETPT